MKNNDEEFLTNEQTLLALERTFLAWIRTGLTGIALGVAISQFVIFKDIRHDELGHRIGQLIILWSGFVFLIAYTSYYNNFKRIAPDRSIKSYSFLGLTLCTFSILLLTLGLFWIVIK